MAGTTNDTTVLRETDRQKLDGIVQKMISNKESDTNIQSVVNDFKQKYGKKKDVAGSPLPSDSSLTTKKTEQSISTSGSVQKGVGDRLKNDSLSSDDVYSGKNPNIGISLDQVTQGIINKKNNIDRWKNAPSDNYIKALVDQKNETQGKINEMQVKYNQRRAQSLPKNEFDSEFENLQNHYQYLNDQIQKEYQAQKGKIVPELVAQLKNVDDAEFDPDTHTLLPATSHRIVYQVDSLLNKKNNAAINAQTSGNLDEKERTYPDITKSVIDNLNLLPIKRAQDKYTEEFSKQHPELELALNENKEIQDYFSNTKFDDVKAKVKINADKSAMQTKERYWGKNGIFMHNQDLIAIQHKYAQLVAEGKMTEEVAKKQITAEIGQNPNLKKIQSSFEKELINIAEESQKQYEQYVIGGLQKEYPKYTIYPDGTPGLANMPEEKYKKLLEDYHKGLDDVAKKMGKETEERWKAIANIKALNQGPLLGSFLEEMDGLMGGLTKMIFNKTGHGGDDVRWYQANEIASPNVSQSDIAATWNFKGWESILDPNFYLSGVGHMVPVIAGGAAVSVTTEGTGLPEYIGWLASAGLFTGQSALSTYNRLLTTKDESGNILSEADAANMAAQQAKEDFLPNVLMMALGSGTLSRAKNIVKPTLTRSLVKGIEGAVKAQPFFTWQGYNDYASMKEAQGKTPDIYDYLQSEDFRDNLVNGLVLGGGMSLVHLPLAYKKEMNSWTKMVHTSEGEFKNLLSQNYALGQEMSGNGGYLRDALKLHVFNIDEGQINDLLHSKDEGDRRRGEEMKRQLADLKNTLLYSINLDKNIRIGNLDRTNAKDLYQAHNLSLADQYDYLSDQATQEGNKSFSDVYKGKAKNYREQAKAAANGEAKYHYLVNTDDHPIFMSDQSFKTLEADGKIAAWMKDGAIKGVHASDDPEFAQRYKDFVATKDEATVEGKDIMDHGSDLIEANKDKLGIYYEEARNDPEEFYKVVADQAWGYGRDSDGNRVKSNLPNAEESARELYGNDIVDLAKVLYPIPEKTGIDLNDEKQVSDVVKRQWDAANMGQILDKEGNPIQEANTGISANGLENITDKKWGHGSDRLTVKNSLKALQDLMSGGKFTGWFGKVKEPEGGMNVRDYGAKFVVTTDDVDAIHGENGTGKLNPKEVEIILNDQLSPFGQTLKNTYPEFTIKDYNGNIFETKKEEEYAQKVRENKGKLPEVGEALGTKVQADSGGNVQQGAQTGAKAGDEKNKIAPEDNITVSEMLDKKGTYKGQKGTFIQDGQTVIFKTDDGKREYELGNVNEIGKEGIHRYGIEPEKSIVQVGQDGKITVRGKEYVNPNEEPLKAIVRDKDGNIIGVKLATPEGERRMFRGQAAQDLAYELTLKQISDNHEQPALEQFINEDEASRKEIDDARLAATSEEPTTGNNTSVQREKIEPKDIDELPFILTPEEEVITSPKTEDHGKAKETQQAEGRKGDVLKQKKEGESEPKKGKTPPPSSPAPPPRTPEESPKDEFTSVRKEKNAEIKGAKELFKQQKEIKWTETYDNALSHLQEMYPDKSLYDAMKSRVGEFVAKADYGQIYNPTSEDIAVFQVFRNETEQRMSEIQGWDSSSNIENMAAAAEFKVLEGDLYNIARITTGEGEVGRALYMLQSEVAQDPDRGLRLRRMKYAADRGGRRLTPEDLEWTAEQWEKEKDMMRQKQELEKKGMEEKFDKKIKELKDDYERRLKAEKKPTSQKEKREQLLKEKGAELAAKIRKGKDFLKDTTMVTFPGLPQGINFVLEGIAKLVEGGFTLAQAIDDFVATHKIKNKDQFQNDLFDILDKRDKQEETYDKIQKLAVADGTTDVTKEMVAKNLIKQYVDSHVGLHDTKDVLDVAHAGLKKILPDLEKDRLREAYLKQGEFKPPTKKELEGGFKESQRNFEKLTALEKDIKDLTEKGDMYKKTHNKPSPYEKEIETKQTVIKSILDSMGVKTSGEDKYKKASYDQRAKAHNERLDGISKTIQDKIDAGGLSDKSQKALIKLKNQLDAAMIKIDPTSALSQERTLDGGLAILKSIKSEFQRSSAEDISKIGDINRQLQKVIEKFSTDKDESEQDIKLQRAKDKAKRDFNDFAGKLSRGEFEDTPSVPLTKTDAELIKLERDRGALAQLYRNKQREYEKKNKTWYRRGAEFLRAAMVDFLISAPTTWAKVAVSAIARPTLESLTRLTFGKGFEMLPFETAKTIAERAKIGGEGTSIKSLKKGWQAYLGQYGEKGLKKLYDNANEDFEKADRNYIQQQSEVDRLKYMGMDKPEYKEAEAKLSKLKNDRDDALISAVGNSMYQFIAGSSLKEGMEVLLHRSALIERQFGDFEREDFYKMKGNAKEKFLSGLDNLQHIMNFVGRGHAALKNFSARFSFATGFMARIEAAVKNGVDVSQPDKILEIAHDAYHDFERGKYQESNWITDTWNKATNAVEKVSPELSYLMRADVAITRVPVNMLREGIMEYTLGAFRGSIMAAREYYKAKGIVLQDGYTPESEAQFRQELQEQLQKIDPDKAATIIRAFRKGGFGLGLYAFALLGHATFGGWAHKGQAAEDKKKMQRELETGNPEVKTGEIWLGDWKMPDVAAKVVEHTPAFYPWGFGLGLSKVYGNNITDGRTTTTAALNSAMAQINHIANSIPMIDKVVIPLGGGALQNVLPSGQWDDVDQDGNPMKRKAFEITDYFKYLHVPFTEGFKKDILSETYYKQAIATQKAYRAQITEVETNTSLSSEDKESQRQALLKQLNDEIDEIYRQNKENPQ